MPDPSGSDECPTTHPTAFMEGAKCCDLYLRSGGCGDSGLLDYGDPSECCFGNSVRKKNKKKPCPTNNALFINFRLSSDAEIFVLSFVKH